MQPRIAALFVLTATLAAQGTEWTSFEDRVNHAMAIDPNGTLVMYGGRVPSTGRDLGDTMRFLPTGWSQFNPQSSPGPLSSHAMAGARLPLGGQAAIILFGGREQTTSSDATWVYSGGNWSQQESVQRPSARYGHAMALDTRRNQIVLFGGNDGSPQQDTWTYDPTSGNWAPVAVGLSPSPRQDHAMAFDPNAPNTNPAYAVPFGVVVLFSGSGFTQDTWSWNGAAWTNTSNGGPLGRRGAAMAYHTNSDKLVIFGGQATGPQFANDTWVFDRTSGGWIQQFPAQSPPARWQHAMAGDQNGNVLMLGGRDYDAPMPPTPALRGSWIWTGSNWSLVAEPSPRRMHSMAFDATGSAILFGGETVPNGSPMNDTWKLEGLSWTQQAGAAPPARSIASMAFDSQRNRHVLFGGATGSGSLNDTWEWTGSSWQNRTPLLATSPPAITGHTMAYDAARQETVFAGYDSTWRYRAAQNAWVQSKVPGYRWAMGAVNDGTRVLMFGGISSLTGHLLDDTWQWDGVEWTQLQPAGPSPAARLSFGMAHDAARNQVVLYGGNVGSTVSADTWLWNGTGWTQQAAASPPGQKNNMAMAYDTLRQRVVMFGGGNGIISYTNDTWEWDGVTWTLRANLVATPSARSIHRMAYDPVRGYMVLFGGHDGNGLQDTWLYDGANWTQRTPATSPPTSWGHSAAYDPVSARVMIHGGEINDTWAWNGSNWARINTVNPGAVTRLLPAFVANVPSRPGLLLYGGDSLVEHFQDTWLLEGSTWTEMSGGFPGNREGGAVAYDPLRQRIVLFGGQDRSPPNTIRRETWEWDGMNWHHRTPAGTLPQARYAASMAFDAARGVCVMFGGVTAGNVQVDDTWEWDGQTWNERLPIRTPGPQANHTLAYDPARNLTVAFGTNGAWDYGSVSPARSIVTFAPGCTSGPSPTLAIAPHQSGWLPGNLVVGVNGAPLGSLAFLAVGFDNLAYNGNPLPQPLLLVGAPQCSLAVNILTSLLMGPIGATTQSVSLPLLAPGSPVPPGFLGIPFHVQALLLAGSTFSASNAARCVTGLR